jgi:hypothetical protein
MPSGATGVLALDAIASSLVAQSRSATRLTDAELREHPDLGDRERRQHPAGGSAECSPPRSSPATATALGVVYLSDRTEGEFTQT